MWKQLMKVRDLLRKRRVQEVQDLANPPFKVVFLFTFRWFHELLFILLLL